VDDRIRVFNVDDHPHVREGMAMFIDSQPDMLMVAQASNGHEAIECFRKYKPDVTLMDLRLPDMSGIDATVAIRTEFPEARIIILTTFDSDTDRQQALAAGASAFVLKNTGPRKVVEAIHQVHAG
jgi:DNA-binding NarL/FixJ family response regulator